MKLGKIISKICVLLFIVVAIMFAVSGRTGQADANSSDSSSNEILQNSSLSSDISDESNDAESSESSSSEAEDLDYERKSLLGLLKTAIKPVGNTMYVWGGGWNEEDTAAGEDAVTIGVSKRWAEFAAQQDKNYDYNTTRYQIRDGLDCSGYIGWVVYNTLETENSKEGYVISSTKMAKTFSDMGFGSYVPANDVTVWQPGDIMSMNGHAWIVVGECSDGSVVLLHSSPPGVILCGTLLADGTKSNAVRLAEKYMREKYPEWYEKYPDCSRSYTYLTSSSKMHWNRETLPDDEEVRKLSAEEVLGILFE